MKKKMTDKIPDSLEPVGVKIPLPGGGYKIHTRRKLKPNRTEYYDAEGRLHREDGPALEWDYGQKEYVIHGQRHRIDGPAVVWWNGDVEYWLNNRQVTAADMPNLTLEDLLQ